MINEKEIKRSIKSTRSLVRGRAHRSVLVRVNNICALVEELLPRANQLDESSQEAHLLSKMTTDYLPNALIPYLSLPREYAEQVPLSDGRTAIQSLCTQLDVMYGQTYQIVHVLLRSDGDRLLANERFLQNKFGPNPLNIPPQPDPAPENPPPLLEQIFRAVSQHMVERSRKKSS